jgi:hypothetical protein
MPSIVIVEKSGSLKSVNTKNLSLPDLYKKCGFKTNEGFSKSHTWTIEVNDIEYKLSVYGKTTGKANTENKFEFPPPIDSILFFGSCAAVLTVDNAISDMTPEEFTDIIDNLQGGYSDIGSEDSEDEEEDDYVDELLPKTKHGYVKDGFVVSSDAEDDDEDADEDDDEDEDDDIAEQEEIEEVVVKPKEKEKKVVAKPKKPKLREEPEPTVYCEELVEDPYVE